MITISVSKFAGSEVKTWKKLLFLGAGLMLAGCAGPQIERTNQAPKATLTSPAVTLENPQRATPSATPAATPTQECSEQVGSLKQLSFPDPVQRSQSIPFNLYLPPCYDARQEDYPVLYLLHGYPQDQDQWVELGLIDLVESQALTSAWPAFIIVMPDQPEPYFTHTDGGPGSWEEVVINGLVPYIDSNYRTLALPQRRAVFGISRGGVWALELGLRNPQVFDTVGALSPALIVNHPREIYDPFWILQHAEAFPGLLWLSTGDLEPSFRLGVDQFASALEQEGIQFNYLVYEGRHEDPAWASILQPVIEFAISGWDANGS